MGEAYGAESIHVAETLFDLADLYRISGDYVQAESLLLRAIAVGEKIAAGDQPLVATTLEGAVGALANLYIDKGDYERAKALLERQRAIVEKLGPGGGGFTMTVLLFCLSAFGWIIGPIRRGAANPGNAGRCAAGRRLGLP